jgi:Ca2+-binding EF-hand superfamily protein
MTAPSVMADMGRRDSMSGFSGPSETFGTRFGDDDGDGQISGEELARMQGKAYNPNSTVKQVLRMTEKTMPGDIGHLASTGTAEGQSIWNRMARIIQIRDLDLRILMDAHDRRNRGFVEISTFRRSLCYAFGNQWIDLAMSSKEFDEIVQPYLTRRPERPGEPEACVMWQRFANDVQALADTGKRTKNFLDRLEKVERDEKMRRTLADRYGITEHELRIAQREVVNRLLQYNKSLMSAFRSMDSDHSGVLYREEVLDFIALASGYAQSGDQAYTEGVNIGGVPDAAVDCLLDFVDVDGDGTVDYKELSRVLECEDICAMELPDPTQRGRNIVEEEKFYGSLTGVEVGAGELQFAQSTIKQRILDKAGSITKAFRFVDDDNSGSLTRDEIMLMLDHFNARDGMKVGKRGIKGAKGVTDGAVEVLLDFVDDEGDGRIQYDEFSAMLMAEDVMEMRPENRGKEKKAIYVRPGGGAQIASQIEGARQPGAIDPRDGQY